MRGGKLPSRDLDSPDPQPSHQGCTAFSDTNCPWGSFSPGGSRARYTGVIAPSSGDLVALGPVMSVLTQPGQQALSRMSSWGLPCLSLRAWILERTVSPVLETPYAVLGQPLSLWTPSWASLTKRSIKATSSSSVMSSLRKRAWSSGLHLLRAVEPKPLEMFTTLPARGQTTCWMSSIVFSWFDQNHSCPDLLQVKRGWLLT